MGSKFSSAEADGIAVVMAGGAGGHRGMGQKTLAHGLEIGIVDIVENGEIDLGGRRRRRLPHEDVQQRHAALGRRGTVGMREQAQEGDLGQQAAAIILGREFHTAPQSLSKYRPAP